jgi:hypothetical protein
MATAEKFRDYADDCVRKAGEAASPDDKNLLLNMGLAWLRLADQIETLAAAHEQAREVGLGPADENAAAAL